MPDLLGVWAFREAFQEGLRAQRGGVHLTAAIEELDHQRFSLLVQLGRDELASRSHDGSTVTWINGEAQPLSSLEFEKMQ